MPRISFRSIFPLLLLFFLLIASCKSAAAPAPEDSRRELGAGMLLGDDPAPREPVQNDFFRPPPDALPAAHPFEGNLQLVAFVMEDNFAVWEERHAGDEFFPAFSAQFVTHDDYLVPVDREIQFSTDDRSRWGIILSPGRVWSEPGDSGYSRAAFPFVLVGRIANEAHNGVATFIYNEEEISRLYFQITQETAAWLQKDYWGVTAPVYEPQPVADGAAVRAQFTAELAAGLPIRPWSELGGLLDEELLAKFNGNLEPEEISAAGLILNGRIYLQPPQTRYGQYPFPRYMRHGVFSVTKSMGAAVALLRLAQTYGDEVFDLRIVDYVPLAAGYPGWEEVTFADALSMATGLGEAEPNPDSPYVTADEDLDKQQEWTRLESAAEKLTAAFAFGNYEWGPGEVVRYNSVHTFVLAAAMDAFLKTRAGPDADIWEMVETEVYRPIGIYHAPIMRTHEAGGHTGLPILSYGLYPTIDDVARVAQLLHDGGRHNGDQLLSPAKLAEALYQSDEQGLPVFRYNQYGVSRYLLSFWSHPFCIDAEMQNCYQLPLMTGFGGNMVMLYPDGSTAFRFADAHNYDPVPLAALAGALIGQQ